MEVLDLLQVLTAGLAVGLVVQYIVNNKSSVNVKPDRSVALSMMVITVIVGAIGFGLSSTELFAGDNAFKILKVACFGAVYISYWLVTQVFRSLRDRMNVYAITSGAAIGVTAVAIGYFI